MTEQPTALRLADELEMWTLGEPAADELRRLHAECNDLAHQLNESNERNGRLIAQRDVLLTVLKEFTGHINERFSGGVWDRARAAIKQAEENT